MTAGERRAGAVLAGAVALAMLGSVLRWRPADSWTLVLELGAVGVLVVVALLAGFALLEQLRMRRLLSGLELLVQAFAVGLGLLVLGILALGLAGRLGRGSVLAWLLLLTIGGLLSWQRTWTQLQRCAAELRTELRSRADAAGWLLLALALLIPFVAAFLPAVFYDSLLYHLEAPQRWLATGYLTATPYVVHLNYPVNTSALYLIASVLAPDGPLSLVHWMLLPGCCLALFALARPLGRGIGLVAALLLAVSPCVLEVASFAIADLAVVFWVLAAVIALLTWVHSNHDRLLLLAGGELGLAIGAKYTAILVGLIPCVVVILLVRYRAGLRSLLWAWLLVAVSCLTTFSPWLLRNGVETGNPLYPYLLDEREPYTSEQTLQREVALRMTEQDGDASLLLHAARGPYELLTTGVGMAPLIGLALLAPLPFLLLQRPLRRRVQLLLVFAGIGFVGWTCTVHLTRYALPFLACLAVPAAAALAAEPRGWRRKLLHLCVGLGLLHNLFLGWLAADWGAVRDLARGALTRTAYITRNVSYYGAVEHANQSLTAADQILFVGEARGYYCRIPHVTCGPARTPLLFELAATADQTSLGRVLRQSGFSHLLLSRSELTRIIEQGGVAPPQPQVAAAMTYLLEHDVEILFDDGNVLLARILPAVG